MCMAGSKVAAVRSSPKARYPLYSEKDRRVQSFAKWPLDKEQTPDELAEAGFFYAGTSDCTRCFFCGGGLRNWLSGDLPIVEHARWFPDCQYVLDLKGKTFVSNVNINFPRNVETDEEQSEGNSKKKSDVGDLIESVLKKPCGEALLALGYPEKLVRAAITNVLSTAGWDVTKVTSEDLARATVDMEDSFNESQKDDVEKTGLSDTVAAVEGATGLDNSKLTESENLKDLSIGDLSLIEENQRLKDQMLCKVCLDRQVSIVFLPCGHLAACDQCFAELSRCPLCRQKIGASIKTFL